MARLVSFDWLFHDTIVYCRTSQVKCPPAELERVLSVSVPERICRDAPQQCG